MKKSKIKEQNDKAKFKNELQIAAKVKRQRFSSSQGMAGRPDED